MAIYMMREDWGGSYTPTANTIAYYPLKSDILDHSGNGKDLSWTNYSFDGNFITVSYLTWPQVTPENTTGDRTVSGWVNTSSGTCKYNFRRTSDWPLGYIMGQDNENWNRPWGSLYLNGWKRCRPSSTSVWTIFLMTRTKTWTTMNLYLNGSLVSTNTSLWTSTRTSSGTVVQWIGSGKYSEIIIEDKVWTAQEVLDYYNLTKWNYWIS